MKDGRDWRVQGKEAMEERKIPECAVRSLLRLRITLRRTGRPTPMIWRVLIHDEDEARSSR